MCMLHLHISMMETLSWCKQSSDKSVFDFNDCSIAGMLLLTLCKQLVVSIRSFIIHIAKPPTMNIHTSCGAVGNYQSFPRRISQCWFLAPEWFTGTIVLDMCDHFAAAEGVAFLLCMCVFWNISAAIQYSCAPVHLQLVALLLIRHNYRPFSK